MAKLPNVNKTRDAIFRLYEERDRQGGPRAHLGASIVGDDKCSRKLWYSFRWAVLPKFDGRMLRLFERGHREEAWVIEDLRAIGVRVEEVDPKTGKQWRVSYLGGHVGGSCDGILHGVPEAPKTPHLFECKTANRKSFDRLVREGVERAKPEHVAQMQLYMHGLELTRALYICVCKDDDRIHVERVRYDRVKAEGILHAARRVVASPEPLERISEDPAWFECRWCDHASICHRQEFEKLERSCRTCAYVTPMEDGRWVCERHKVSLDYDGQRAGCDDHLFIPKLLPFEPAGFDKRLNAMSYKMDGLRLVDHARQLHVLERDFDYDA